MLVDGYTKRAGEDLKVCVASVRRLMLSIGQLLLLLLLLLMRMLRRRERTSLDVVIVLKSDVERSVSDICQQTLISLSGYSQPRMQCSCSCYCACSQGQTNSSNWPWLSRQTGPISNGVTRNSGTPALICKYNPFSLAKGPWLLPTPLTLPSLCDFVPRSLLSPPSLPFFC